MANLFMHFDFPLLENKVCANNAVPDVMHILHYCFKVRSCIIGTGNKDVVGFAGTCWRVNGGNGDEPGRSISMAI